MGNAFACDLTGGLVKGQPATPAVIDLGKDIRLRVLVDRQITKGQWEQGHIGPAAAEKIGDALRRAKLVKPPEVDAG